MEIGLLKQKSMRPSYRNGRAPVEASKSKPIQQGPSTTREVSYMCSVVRYGSTCRAFCPLSTFRRGLSERSSLIFDFFAIGFVRSSVMFKQLSRVRRAAVPGLRTAAPVSSPPVASTSSAATRNVGSKATSQSGNGSSKTTHLQSQPQSRKLSTSSPASRNASAVKASANPQIPSASASEDLLQVTTLPNGVRVATDGTPGHFVAAGVYVGAGSRFEWEGNSGSSHMIDRLAYKVRRTQIELKALN